LATFVDDSAALDFGSVRVETVALMRSELKPTGPVYSLIDGLALRAVGMGHRNKESAPPWPECTAEEAGLAEDIGRRLAQAGFGVVCGGKAGVMEAACRGAWQAGGLTVGLLPGGEVGEGNDYLTLELPTGLGEARNMLVVRAGEAVIAIGGGLGTLGEIALALRMGKTVVALASWQATSPDGSPLPAHRVESAEEAIAAVLRSRR
jgi:uncharacterized protein (TIGR00725 family)